MDKKYPTEEDFPKECVGFKTEQSVIISKSKKMKKIFNMIRKAAISKSSVLITGESGTGKELIAKSLHDMSRRSSQNFVAINCAAIPSELLESELFGHERGSFTGAHRRYIGKFEFADKGTVFLDEISSMRIDLQAKLLRILQESELCRVGSNRPVKVNVRVITASNQCLKNLIEKGSFREDLYYRLYVIPIELPPLRERKEDIKYLTSYFLKKYNKNMKKNIRGLSPEAMCALESYGWPGNIRELENLIERVVVLSADEAIISLSDLPESITKTDQNSDRYILSSGLIPARQAFEREYIIEALKGCLWNQSKTARLLNIHRNTLTKKMRSLNISLKKSL